MPRKLGATGKPRADDDEGYPPQGGCIGSGAVHDLSPSGKKRPAMEPISFVRFPEKEMAPKISRSRSGTKRPKKGTRRK